MNQNMMNNRIIQNAIRMYKSNDNKGLEQMARNLCQEKGIDANEIKSQAESFVKQRFGLK